MNGYAMYAEVENLSASDQIVRHTFPRSPSSMAFRQIAKKTKDWPVPKTMEGHLEFFIERLINYSAETQTL